MVAAIDLPDLSRWAQVTPKYVSLDATAQTSPLDGTSQVVLRMGDKWSLDVALPAKGESAAAPWLGPWAESRATGATLRLAWPQPPLAVPVGAPQVAGANQLGATLNVDGLTPGVLLTALRFFSFSDGTRLYLHQLTRDVIAAADGTATLNLSPLLRVKPPDNAALEFPTPKIEGLMTAAPSWGLSKLRFYAVSFTLQENR